MKEEKTSNYTSNKKDASHKNSNTDRCKGKESSIKRRAVSTQARRYDTKNEKKSRQKNF